MAREILLVSLVGALFVLVVPGCSSPPLVPTGASSVTSPDPTTLRPAADFRSIRNRSARSAAIFTEAARVIQSPRCLNCHPVTRSPSQGDDLHTHVPVIRADERGHGPPGLPCSTCHQGQNVATHLQPIESIPGHAHWMLAPSSMGWQEKSARQICEQIKDPARNGGRSLMQIHEHMLRDTLVGWAWNPGAGRTPAPGTQQLFGELIAAWIETGAACP
jgi:hypothetical protein